MDERVRGARGPPGRAPPRHRGRRARAALGLRPEGPAAAGRRRSRSARCRRARRAPHQPRTDVARAARDQVAHGGTLLPSKHEKGPGGLPPGPFSKSGFLPPTHPRTRIRAEVGQFVRPGLHAWDVEAMTTHGAALEASSALERRISSPLCPPAEMDFAAWLAETHLRWAREPSRVLAPGCRTLPICRGSGPRGPAGLSAQPQAARLRPGGPRRLPGGRRGHQPAAARRVRAVRLPNRAQRAPPRARRAPHGGRSGRLAVGRRRRQAAPAQLVGRP